MEKSHPAPFSELLGGTVGHAFSHSHTHPPHSSRTDNWTVLWRIWTLKGNLSHLIIGIQRMLFICINTNKTHSPPAQKEPALKRKSYYKTFLSLWNWTKDFRWRNLRIFPTKHAWFGRICYSIIYNLSSVLDILDMAITVCWCKMNDQFLPHFMLCVCTVSIFELPAAPCGLCSSR